MTTLSFDTLKYVKQLTAANVPVEQAEAQAEALHSVLDAALADQSSALATKADILKLDAKIDLVRSDLRGEIELVRKDVVIKLGGVLIAGFGIVIGILIRLMG